MKYFLMLLAVVGVAIPAQAAIINPYVVPGFNQADDTNFERLLGDADDIIEVGETLEAIGLIGTFNSIDFGLPPLTALPVSGYNLTFHSKIKVLSFIDENDTNGNGMQDGGESAFTGVGDFIFGNGFDDGSAIHVYEDGNGTNGSPASLFTSQSGVGADIGNATDGTLILSLGLNTTTADDFWVALDSPSDISVFSQQAGASGGVFWAGLSILNNPGNVPIFLEVDGGGIVSFLTGTTHDIILNGELKNRVPLTSAGWDAQSDTTFEFNSTVPEPASIVIWGVLGAAIALATLRRRQQR